MRLCTFLVTIVLLVFLVFMGYKNVTLKVEIEEIKKEISKAQKDNKNISVLREKVFSPQFIEGVFHDNGSYELLSDEDIIIIDNR